MTSTRAYRIAAVSLAWLILRGQVPGFAETGEDRVYWADIEGIYWSNLEEGTTQRIIAADTRRPGKIAVDVAGGKIYWVDRRGGTVQWSDLDGSNSEPLPEGGYPLGINYVLEHSTVVERISIALDLEQEKLYCAVVFNEIDYVDGAVFRCNLDGSDTEELSRRADSPTLALDSAKGGMYLTAWGRGIYRLDQDGSGFETVLGSVHPRDIAIDPIDGKLYWTEDRAIRRANTDGSGVEDVLAEMEHSPGEIALDLEGGKVYWTVLNYVNHVESYGGLLRANLDGSEVEHVVEQGEVVGFTLELMGSKVYWTDARGTIQRADLDGSNPEDIFAPLVRAPYALALDAKAGRIYWTDLLSGTVQRSGPDGSAPEILVGGLDAPKGVCLGGGRIYWADSAAGKIQSADLDGSDMEDIVTDLDHPEEVALDLAQGRIYWTERFKRLINRAHLDGSSIEGFPASGYPRGIALDLPGDRIYWTWSGHEGGRISRSSLEGTDVEDLVASDGYDFYGAIALDVVGDSIYWICLHGPGPNSQTVGVAILRAELDGSGVEEAAWISHFEDWPVPLGLRAGRPVQLVGNSLALDLSHQTAVSAGNSVPLSTTLRSSYPNPVNGSTLISYTLAAPGPVALVVYNTLGQPVRTLVDKVQAPGAYSVPWQPAETLASGVYLYRLTTPDAVLTRRLALLR